MEQTGETDLPCLTSATFSHQVIACLHDLWLPEARSPPSPLGLVHVREPFFFVTGYVSLRGSDRFAQTFEVLVEHLGPGGNLPFDLKSPKRNLSDSVAR